MNEPLTLVVTLTGKRCKVVEAKEPILESIVICPHCGNKTTYENLRSIHGKAGCESCFQELKNELSQARVIDREHWLDKDWEPYGA